MAEHRDPSGRRGTDRNHQPKHQAAPAGLDRDITKSGNVYGKASRLRIPMWLKGKDKK